MAKKKAKADAGDGGLADQMVREQVGSAGQTGGPFGPPTAAATAGPAVENLIRDRVVRMERLRAGDVRANPKNFRTHSKSQADTQLAVMKRVGFAGALLAYQPADGGGLMLIDGHLRQELTPDDVVPVLVLDVTDKEASEILASYDPIGAMAGTNCPALLALLSDTGDLMAAAPALADNLAKLLGGGVTTPKSGKTDPDDVPDDVSESPSTKIGDVWILGDHRVVCGDATDRSVIAEATGGNAADMLLTDPPYGVSYVGKGSKKMTLQNDDLSDAGLRLFVAELFGSAFEACRPGAYCYATVPSGPLHKVFLDQWCQAGVLRQTLIWVKDQFVFGYGEYHYQHEPILFGWVPGQRLPNPNRSRSSVWEFARPKKSTEHPTMKPVALWEKAIVDGSRTGDLILDPCCGSGTTIIAAERLSRRTAAVELSPVYCDVIVKRWEEFTGKKARKA